MIVSHAAPLVAVHAQPVLVVTAIGEPAPPADPIEALPGAIEYMQDGAAACVTVNVRPATVSSPVRVAPVFAAAVNPTVPAPLPVAPEVIVSHEAPLEAVHAQSARVVTVTAVPAPPLAPID